MSRRKQRDLVEDLGTTDPPDDGDVKGRPSRFLVALPGKGGVRGGGSGSHPLRCFDCLLDPH